MKYYLILFVCFFSILCQTSAQVTGEQPFTRYDTLRGKLSPLRTAYDVSFYNLHVRVNPATQHIAGYNTIRYRTTADFDKIQVDLFSNMQINRIVHRGAELAYERDSNAVFITFPQLQRSNQVDSITIYYEGRPLVAENPPWDGGFVWQRDQTGKPWIGVATEGIGASLWWPCKDHLSEEPDSMRITLEVPTGLKGVANGKFMGEANLNDGYTRFAWRVSYPINNYNVTLNIADYANFSETYTAQDGSQLALNYYVLRYNLAKAQQHFTQVKPMLACYEKLFGKYPFWNDGYALVETPYLGMEHQSAIAYGNNYQMGYDGQDLTGTGIGLKFDYLIIHESGHEYWGNSVSARDHAEMWIHESFCTYSEALYLECMMDYETSVRYLVGAKRLISNREPIIGPPDVNYTGWQDSDMYFKGAWMLHTLRNAINNDKLWFEVLYGIAQEFKISNTSTEEIVAFVNQKTGTDYTYLFDQYLRHAYIPQFTYEIQSKGKKSTLRYKWDANVADFRMPLKVGFGKGEYQLIRPTMDWQTITLKGRAADFKIATELFYIRTKQVTGEKTSS